MNYEQFGGPSAWLEKEQSRKRRHKWIVAGSAITIVVIIVAVVAGVLATKHKNSSTSSSSGSSSSTASGTTGGGTVVQSDPNDPSTFTKDSRLHQSFYGIAYSPAGVILPDCGATQADVIEDIQLLSQLTTRIRLYGADCNQTSLVLAAIKATKVDMQVWVGNYVVPGDDTAYTRQKAELATAFKQFGVDHVAGVTVGNEYMLNYLTDNGGADQDINGAVANTGAKMLITWIEDTRSFLPTLNLGKTLPVGTSDAGSYFNNMVLEAVDYGMANVHAWFADVTAEQAAPWVFDFFDNTDVLEAQAVTNKPSMYIAETGWPTTANDTAHLSNGVGTASEAGLQSFLDDFICQANANNTNYFMFEAFDELWKDAQFGGVEAHWGLFTANKTLKHITIPKC
ncbi:glycoside hydrolase family 17 protein [Sphaerobolus stellatus SS14]|nr:glycoside hydrolase family 17 protein [Sphaerobolus stellatus SS14]